MKKLIMLGTGNASVMECYNTCFALENHDEYLLVDAGGGNGILKQLQEATIPLEKIKNMIVTHSHSDHILGVVWVYRMIATKIKDTKYKGNFTIYCHLELAEALKTILTLTLQKKLVDLLDQRIFIEVVDDGQIKQIMNHDFTFFDIQSSKLKQFGFSLSLKDGKLTCLGDEPCHPSCTSYVKNAKWLLSEAFCLYSQRDIFEPYKKHHSTVKEASELADKFNVKNLILYHTEEKNLMNRKELYTSEAKEYFKGTIFVPNDLEVVIL